MKVKLFNSNRKQPAFQACLLSTQVASCCILKVNYSNVLINYHITQTRLIRTMYIKVICFQYRRNDGGTNPRFILNLRRCRGSSRIIEIQPRWFLRILNQITVTNWITTIYIQYNYKVKSRMHLLYTKFTNFQLLIQLTLHSDFAVLSYSQFACAASIGSTILNPVIVMH
jgi:hypothetical protein